LGAYASPPSSRAAKALQPADARAPSRPGFPKFWLYVGAGVGVIVLLLVAIVVVVASRPGPATKTETRRTEEASSKGKAVRPTTDAGTTAKTPATSTTGGTSTKTTDEPPAKPAPPPTKTETEEYDPRAAVAASLLEQAKAYLKSNPDDPWGYKEKLEELRAGYARTPPAAEAARLLGELKLPPTPGPRAWWKLDEASGTTAADSAGNGKDGVLYNSPVWTGGRDGGALSFNGSDTYVQAPSLGLSGKLTILAWINPTNLSGDRGIVGEDGSYSFKTFGTQLRFTTPKVKDHDMAAALVTGAWQHVAVTFRAGATGGAKFYKDGKLLGAMDASSMAAGSTRFLIGQNQWNDQNFAGAIDDVRVYATCLSAAEVLEVYNSYGAAPPAATTQPANVP
jgi:hypothetical protein